MRSDISATYLHNCCEYLKIYSSFLWKHYFVQDTYQITYGRKWTLESIYLKIHTDIINEPPLKSFRNRAHENEKRVQRAYKSRLRSKNTQTNLKRSTSKRFGGVFFFYGFVSNWKYTSPRGKVKRQIDSFDGTLRIYVYSSEWRTRCRYTFLPIKTLTAN